MSLEALEKKLARTKQKRGRSGGKREKESYLPKNDAEGGGEESIERKEKKIRIGMIVGVGTALTLIAVLSVVGIIVWRFNGVPETVDLEVSVPATLYRGVPFEMAVKVVNLSSDLLQNVVVYVKTPEDVAVLTALPNQNALVSEKIGDMGGGSVTQRTFSLVARSKEGTSAKITVAVEYGIGRSRFEAERKQSIAVQKNPLTLSLIKPDYVVRGSEFDLEIAYENTSAFDFPEIVLEAHYPSSFQFRRASLTPDSLNNYWRLGAVNHGSKGKLSIRGVLDGVPEQESNPELSLVASAVFLGKSYPIAEETANLTIAPSPIRLDVTVNKNPSYIARIGDRLVYTIQYQNQSGIALADMVIRADLVGELFDFSSLQTNGVINPITHEVTWNADSVPALRLLDPGASGEVDLEVRLRPIFPLERLSDKNFTVQLRVRADSPSVPYYLTAPKTSAAALVETKVSGLVFLDSRVLHRDAGGGMVNTGTVPPRVGEPTQYTVHWILRNYATDVKNVVVQAKLEDGVRWTGLVKSNAESVPLFDEDMKTITWTLDAIPATRGVISDPLEAIFQIEVTPTSFWVGQFEPLIGPTKLRAVDAFTGLELMSGDLAVTTAIPDDETVGQAGGRVVP